jgi:hypothetical protein
MKISSMLKNISLMRQIEDVFAGLPAGCSALCVLNGSLKMMDSIYGQGVRQNAKVVANIYSFASQDNKMFVITKFGLLEDKDKVTAGMEEGNGGKWLFCETEYGAIILARAEPQLPPPPSVSES